MLVGIAGRIDNFIRNKMRPACSLKLSRLYREKKIFDVNSDSRYIEKEGKKKNTIASGIHRAPPKYLAIPFYLQLHTTVRVFATNSQMEIKEERKKVYRERKEGERKEGGTRWGKSERESFVMRDWRPTELKLW